MSLRNNYDYTNSNYSEHDPVDDPQTLSHKRALRKQIEDRMESKRLRDACRDDWDELNDEFDWEQLDK